MELTIAGTDIYTNNTADIQMVREESSLPDSMLYRLENLRIAQEDYQAGLDGFWQEEKMSRVRDKIREYAEENGMSEQDVIAGINKDTDMNLSEISQVFNEAYENSPAAKTAKEKNGSCPERLERQLFVADGRFRLWGCRQQRLPACIRAI